MAPEDVADPIPTFYTIGHSRHRIEDLIALLEKHAIGRVVDVRGQPYSRHNPQFNRERFRKSLQASGIDYVWRGDHLSGRPKGQEYYGAKGEVLWERLGESAALRGALDDLSEEACPHKTALLCAEEDPNRCHRRFLLTPQLVKRGIEVLHIRGDGRLEAEKTIQEREATAETSRQGDLFE